MNARVRPTNRFVEFGKHEIEQSIPQRFEKIVKAYPDRIAIRTKTDVWTYESLNGAANKIAERILNETPNGNEQSLPQTNGKVDRQSLPRPERVRPNLASSTFQRVVESSSN